MRDNIVIGDTLQQKIDRNTLNAADYFILALADRLAVLFPAGTVYTSAQQQGAQLLCRAEAVLKTSNADTLMQNLEQGVEL